MDCDQFDQLLKQLREDVISLRESLDRAISERKLYLHIGNTYLPIAGSVYYVDHGRIISAYIDKEPVSSVSTSYPARFHALRDWLLENSVHMEGPKS